MEKFTPVVCVFDPIVDIEEVDQFGYLDLRQAFLTGTVDGSLAPSDEAYNGMDDPDGVLPASKDTFEAIRQAEKVSAVKSAAKAEAASGDKASSSAAAE